MRCNNCKILIKNAGAYVKHINNCELNINLIINIRYDYIYNKLSIINVSKKHNIKKAYVLLILNKRTRSNIESAKISATKRIGKVTSEETKLKLRNARLNWMKNNPEKTAWRTKTMSYPEKIFNNYIIENNLNNKYLIIRELSVFPYFVDFAFINEKIAVEIDGSQHLLPNVIEKDIKKDKLLNELGWKVIRVSAKSLITDFNNTIIDIFNTIETMYKYSENIKIGIFNDIELKQKLKKEKLELKLKQKNIINNNYINLILNSDIDFSKFGWVNKVAILINKKPQKVNQWMKKYMLEFYNNNCFKRN